MAGEDVADVNKFERAGVDITDSSSGGSGDCCGLSCLLLMQMIATVMMIMMIDEGMTIVTTNTSSPEKGKHSLHFKTLPLFKVLDL